jgi:hypothetical protein
MENAALIKAIQTACKGKHDWESASVTIDGIYIEQSVYHFDDILYCLDENKTAPMFREGNYYFWRDMSGLWNITIGPDDWMDLDEDNPPHCAYKSPIVIARLKDINL